MSSGTYCIIRDLGPVKGGKGMRHHEVLVTFSLKAFARRMTTIIAPVRRLLRRDGIVWTRWSTSLDQQHGRDGPVRLG